MLNMHKTMLAVALSQAIPSEGTESGNNAPMPEVLAAMPQDSRNPSGPVGRNYSEAGKELAEKILSAEQGVKVAGETLSSTKLDGLKMLVSLPTEENRVQVLTAAAERFIAITGTGKMSKNHNNYMGELRRIATHLRNGTLSQDALMAKLTAKGDYATIVQSIPKVDARGGSNAGTGQKGLAAQVAALVQQVGAGNVQITAKPAETEAQPIAQPQPTITQNQPMTGQGKPSQEGALSKVPAQPPAAHVESTQEIIQKVSFLNENQIEPVAAALAKRCQMSNSDTYKELGAMIFRILDAEAIPAAQQQAASDAPPQQAVNG